MPRILSSSASTKNDSLFRPIALMGRILLMLGFFVVVVVIVGSTRAINDFLSSLFTNDKQEESTILLVMPIVA